MFLKSMILSLLILNSSGSSSEPEDRTLIIPFAGYGPTPGFMLGGFMVCRRSEPPWLQKASLGATYGFKGVHSVLAGFERTRGDLSLDMSLRMTGSHDLHWYGWGNCTSPDSTATYSCEENRLTVQYSRRISDTTQLTGGVDLRHSSIYDREDSYLWERLPGQVFDATVTGGLSGRISITAPVLKEGTLLFEPSGFFQGGDVSYSGIQGKVRADTRLWSTGRLMSGVTGYRHFGSGSTPLPYTPGLGSNAGFRGYSDFRFTGPVWVLGQIEFQQKLFSISEDLLAVDAAIFAEAGQAAETLQGLSLQEVHTDIGCGLRFNYSRLFTLRFDTAWGDEGMVFSAGMGEAF